MLKESIRNCALTLTVFALVLSGCKKQDLQLSGEPVNANLSGTARGIKKNFPNEVASRWFDAEINFIKSTPGFSPPVASRALGYTGVTLYESIVESMPEFSSLQAKLGYAYTLPAYRPDVKLYWPGVANAALYTIVKNLFSNTTPANLSAMNNLYIGFHNQYSKEVVKEDLDASEMYGKAVAEVIFNWSKTDGIFKSLINYTASQYSLPVFEGAWIPTAPGFAQPLLPFWGENRPFLAQNVDAPSIPSPLPYGFSTIPTSDFYKQALEVYQTGKNLTPGQKTIALYWNDGAGSITPPGHTMNITTQLIRSNNLSLEEAAVAYAKVGMAEADAFIACWKGKYKYSCIRPISYIQQNIDASWTSLIATPPFPSYASGHATVSGAVSAMLTAIFGDNVSFTDYTYESTFGRRQFSSFYQAAEEAAASRLYGGIHFRIDNEVGLLKGKTIGQNIANLRLKK